MADIPEWALKKAQQLAADESYAVESFARYIAEHETAPVDPDVLAVREILATTSANQAYAKEYMNGNNDCFEHFGEALIIYREHASKRNG